MLWKALHLFIAYSYVPTFCSLMLALAIWGQPLRTNLKKGFIYCLIFSIYTDFSVQLMHTMAHIFSALAAHVILLTIFFRELPFRVKGLVIVTMYVLVIINEGVFGGIAVLLYGREMSINSTLETILLMWPTALIYLWAAYWIQLKGTQPGTAAMAFLAKRNNKAIAYLILFLLIQLFVLILGATSVLGDPMDNFEFLPYFSFVAGSLSIISILLALRWMVQSREEAVRITQQHYIEDLNRLFTTVRGQRHDFLNHVTVIQGFLKLKKYTELEQYTKELVGEVTEMNELVQIGHPALSALIQSKLVTAERKKIKLLYTFSGMEQLALGAKSVDLVKIMGNLIDNAMDEVERLPQAERWVEVTGSIENGDVWLTTRNPGRVIQEQEQARLFQHGYSTKQDGTHSGVGLSVVKDRVEYYLGDVNVESGPDRGTVFTVRLPIAGRRRDSQTLSESS